MADSFVTINGLRLDVPGFATVDDLTPLQRRARKRGTNFTSDGVTGTTFQPKVADELPVLLQVLVFGMNNHLGVAHPFARAGFQANYDHIHDTCVAASDLALVPLVLTLDDGTTRTADVECLSFDVARYGGTRGRGAVWVGPLEIVVPTGKLD